MSLKCSFDSTHQKSPLTPNRNLEILRSRAFRVRECRVWRRPRLKTNRKSVRLVLYSQLGLPSPSPFENLFQSLVSQFPSVNSLDLLAPALGFAFGVALHLSRSNPDRISDVGEWILFTSPTPFNRFVMLRCPSVSFEGSELLEDVNEKLVKEDRHFVRLDSGRIVGVRDDSAAEEEEEKLVYQRECVSTDDGGVISLDWPANLDLTKEHGLDTTILLVPGTVEGSMDRNIRSFVCESLRRGYFPVVVNPRGCADSPLTTARLFTAADSDDICTAVQFISRARPWTTLMAVGWGYGANMLTKYLGEVGETTPLTAATCIDNPFDLEEATRSSPYHIVVDQKLTDGLKDILRSNKELFRGRSKGFDVEKALLAKSVRDFEKAISMVSYGFDVIEDFYAKSSTRDVIKNVKIPVLFIQNDDGTVPLFSIPRSSIAENPFTSLLLCSCLRSKVIASGRSAIYWYQRLSIEWLAAVELGLLKGRHPLLKDVDVTINPSKGFTQGEGSPSDKIGRVNKLLNLSKPNSLNGYAAYPFEERFGESDSSVINISKFRRDPRKNPKITDKGWQQESNDPLEDANSLNAEVVKEEVSPIDNERGQVLQTAQVVMNMLDVTMPNSLTEEQKKKVLTAVGQGETVVKAFQDAVPEDVRGKLTTAVSGILQNQGTNLKLDKLQNMDLIPTVASELKSKIQENVGLPSAGGYEDPHSSDLTNRIDDLEDNSKGNQVPTDKPAESLESEIQASDTQEKAIDGGQGNISSSVKEDSTEWKPNHGNVDMSSETAAGYSDYNENGSDTGPSQSERASGDEGVTVDQSDGVSKLDMGEEDNNPVSSSEIHSMESDGSNNLKGEEKSTEFVPDHNRSDSLTFGVSQAFDAFTGMDDSTQVAVNSVFGVIENMITQLEVEKDNETKIDGKKEVENRRIESVSESRRLTNDKSSMREEENENDLTSQSDNVHDDGTDLPNDARTSWAEEIPIRTTDPVNSITSSLENGVVRDINDEIETRKHLVSSKLLAEHSNKVGHLPNVPPYITANPYGDSLYNEYLRKYLLSKMPNTKSLDLDTTTTLFLDYFPEEDQWKLLEQPGNNEDSAGDADEGTNKDFQAYLPSKEDTEGVIEPLYVIMDTERQRGPVQDYNSVDDRNQEVLLSNDTSEELMSFVKNIILDSLKAEVGRKLTAANTKEMEPNLAREMEKVANAITLPAGQSKDHILLLDGQNCNSEKLGTLNGEHIIRAIALAIQETTYLKRLLPVGFGVGSSLAALRKFFYVATVNGSDQGEAMTPDQINQYVEGNRIQPIETKANLMFQNEIDQKYPVYSRTDVGKAESNKLSNGKVMVGAFTAALGASALLGHQRGIKDSDKRNETSKTLSKSFEEKVNHHQEPEKVEEEISEKSENNMVTSLSEKAMSVAGPVVPTKEDGEVDHERLVVMLAELGQKGGMLRLVGKIALLWGGLRGAISLTDKLISFLRISERPLLQRILGFVGMALLLWSPVVIPLLSTLVKSWATHNSSRIAEFICIVGLYASIMILVMLWGKRIRGYENPFKQYGLDFFSLSKLGIYYKLMLATCLQIQDFLMGLVGGVMLVLAVHSLNVLLGSVLLSWPSTSFSYSSDAVVWLKEFGKVLLLVGQGIITATGIALVEELLFRSWLPDEIATDLGYHRGVIFSGLAFSLSQRSPWAIPGLWLLSLGLAGARQRSQGSLSIPIGLRSGIMASSFVLQMGGFLTYKPNFPLWITGTHPFQPFSGVAGLAFALLFAIILYPRQPLHQQKKTREICE